MIAVELSRVDSSTDDDGICHLYCECDPDLALCGLDVTDFEDDDDFDAFCVVCEDLVDVPCTRCGQ